MKEIPSKVRGLYLVPPHGTWLITGEKKALLKSRKFQLESEWFAIVEDQQLLGVAKFSGPIEITRERAQALYELHRVSKEEMDRWWPEAEVLYLYFVEEARPYETPIPFDTPPGVQTFIAEVKLPKEPVEKEAGLTVQVLGVLGLVDAPGKHASVLLEADGYKLRLDKGSEGPPSDGVVVTHAHPDHIGALSREDVVYAGPKAAADLRKLRFRVTELQEFERRKVGPFWVSVCPVLHSVKAPAYAVRVDSEYGSVIWAPDVLGFFDKNDRNEFLDGADLMFVDGSHPAGLVRRAKGEDEPIGHVGFKTALSWAQKASVKKVVFIHFGEATLGLDEEERVELLKDLEAQYGVSCEFAEEGKKYELLKKLELERFRSEGIDFDIENAAERWRELLRDHQLLHIGFSRLKRGQAWGEWTEDDIVRYHAKVVDALRGLYFPMPRERPVRSEMDEWFNELNRKSAKYEETKPPDPEKVPEWDKKREELIKGYLASLYESLPERFLVCPSWASLTGSLVYGQHPPNDIDIILRTTAPSGSLLKLERVLAEKVNLPVQFSLDPAGPTWDYVPLYDLVAVKRPFEVVRVAESPEVRERLYKALEKDPSKIAPDRPFVHYGVAGEFYIPQELTLAWEKWARRQVERGTRIVIQPKFDGIRFIVGKRGNKVWVWTERGKDVSHNFPNLAKALGKIGRSFVIDCEFVQFEDEKFQKQISRTQMTWMATAKAPQEGAFIKIFVHDLAYLDGDVLAELPYSERLKRLTEKLPDPVRFKNYMVERAETLVAGSRKDFEEAVLKLSRPKAGRSTEGAMAKAADFQYDPLQARGLVVKLKNRIEIDCLIIGYRRMPVPKPQKVKWTKEEAEKNLKWTDTYILRVALQDEKTGKFVPLESKKKLTARDLKLSWNEERQAWEGTDDPEIWTMLFDLPHRQEGEYAYGNVYAIKLDRAPKPGDIVTVAPMELTYFEDEAGLHISWQHPIPVGLKERGAPVGTVQASFEAHRKALPEKDFAVYLDVGK